MDEDEFQNLVRLVGHGERSFAVLRNPVGNRPLAASEQIADSIAEGIALGSITPGAPLREQALAAEFSVSRGPVRAALHLLERDGLVRLLPNRGAVVTDYSLREMHHIDQIAVPIIRLYLELLLERVSDETLAELAEAEKRIERLLDLPDHVPFVLALAQLTLIMARFRLGQPGEMIFQLLYRPSIRHTIAGLSLPGAVDDTRANWRRHQEAMQRRDGAAAAHASLELLRYLHNRVLPG